MSTLKVVIIIIPYIAFTPRFYSQFISNKPDVTYVNDLLPLLNSGTVVSGKNYEMECLQNIKADSPNSRLWIYLW